MTHHPFISTPAVALAAIFSVFSFPSVAKAQQGNSAKEAVNTMSVQLGPQAVQWIAEIQGINGVPQPTEWHVLAYDSGSPQLLRQYWAAQGRAGDNGADLERYPRNVPVGYFTLNQLSVDSVAAFTIAEGEARKAKMGFDSCSYLLRVREYSSEPIWRLELIDINRQTVGKVYISGQNGEVLRTVWVDFSQGGKITDSSAPGNRNSPLGTGLSTTGVPAQGRNGAITAITENYTSPGTVPGQSGISSTTPPTGFTQTPPRMTTTTRPAGSAISPTPARKDPVATVRPPAIPPAKSSDRTIRDLRTMPTKPVVTQPAPAPKPKPKPVSKPPVPKSTKKPSGGRIPPPPIPPGS